MFKIVVFFINLLSNKQQIKITSFKINILGELICGAKKDHLKSQKSKITKKFIKF